MLRLIVGIGALQVGAVVFNLLRSKLVAVLLGPQGVGAIGLVDQLVQLVLYVSTLSLPLAAIRFLSRAHSESFEAFRDTYGSFLRVLLLLTSAGMVLGAVVASVRPDLLGPDLARYRDYLIPGLISVPAVACHGLFNNVLAAARRTRAAAWMTLLVAAALTMAAVAGVYLGGIQGLYWGTLVASLLVAVATAAYLRWRLDLPLLPRGRGIREELRRNPDILAFAFTLYANMIAYSLAFFVARYTVLDHFGEYEAGLLQAAIGLFISLNAVLSRANAVYLTPVVNRRIPIEDKMNATREFVRKHWVIVLLVMMPVVLFAPWVLVVLYSPAFLALRGVVTLFVIAQCLQLMAGNYYILMMGLDDLRMFGMLTVVGYAAVAGLSWLLAPGFGIVGVGTAFVIGFAFSYALATWRLRVRHRMPVEARSWLHLAYGLVALAIGGILANWLDPWNPLAIAGKAILYLLFAISLLGLLDRAEFRQLVLQGQGLLFPAGPEHSGRAGASAYRRLTQRFFPEAWETSA